MTDILLDPPPLTQTTPPAAGRVALETSLAVLRAGAADWLTPGRQTVIAAAPGRLDVMGGIADYSGAVVLEGTIGDLAIVAVQRRPDDCLRVRTVGPQTGRLAVREFVLPRGAFYAPDGSLRPYDAVRRLFDDDTRWAAYVLGVFYVLLAEGELATLPCGVDVLLHSSVPLGAGVASSAAVEVATMRAAGVAFGVSLEGLRLAALCQMVENRVVGAPCGIMDQVTCVLGQAGMLLALRCQPHDVLGWHAPPAGYGFAGLDSGVKHAVGGRRYGRARCAAFMGRRIIGEHLRAAGEDERRVAYLCNLTPREFRRRFRDLLPVRLAGHEFLAQWGETGDAATTIDPAEVYPVRGATEHPIYENDRVVRFIARLKAARGGRLDALQGAGRLMYGAHRSYSRNCGLGCQETDLLVSLVRRAGPGSGLFGAKITGGGSGGTVAVLLEAGPDGVPSARAVVALHEVAERYAQSTHRAARLISGSRDGAGAIAPLTLSW